MDRSLSIVHNETSKRRENFSRSLGYPGSGKRTRVRVYSTRCPLEKSSSSEESGTPRQPGLDDDPIRQLFMNNGQTFLVINADCPKSSDIRCDGQYRCNAN